MIARLLALCLIPVTLGAAPCEDIRWEGTSYTICPVDPARTEIRLFLKDDTGQTFGRFAGVDQSLGQEGKTLGFAMNAGMYHPDRRPVGLYIEDGEKIAALVETEGPGNFGMLPNGVLCLRAGRADVIETARFAAQSPDCRWATQSGPMLVIDEALHPRFLPASTSRFVRNGVGTAADGSRVVFAVSNAPVNFHTFARLFRDHLRLPNALYLDGRISRLHAPNLGRSDLGFPLGPIVGTVVSAP